MSNAPRRLTRTGILALTLTLVATSIPAQARPSQARPGQRTAQAAPKATQVASVEGITEYSLPNGMRVLLFPDPSKPTVTVNVTYLVTRGTAKRAWRTCSSTCSSRARRSIRMS